MSRLHVWQNARWLGLGLALVLGLVLLVGLLAVMGLARSPRWVAAEGPAIRYVAPAGSDSGNDCTDSSAPCATLQHAVDVADAGNEIRVATGIYTDVHARPRADIVSTGLVTQAVYISKTVALRGGYTTTDWNASHPVSHPTTLDAEGKGRGIYITGEISSTIEGLVITRGSADGLQGGWQNNHSGGGVYVISATAVIRNNTVYSNTSAKPEYLGHGGGLYIRNSAGVLVSGNTVTGNRANEGGGVYLYQVTSPTLVANVIDRNVANPGDGVYLDQCPGVMLLDNTITDNGLVSLAAEGGGLHLEASPSATVSGNTISGHNAAWGGGVYLFDCSLGNCRQFHHGQYSIRRH